MVSLVSGRTGVEVPPKDDPGGVFPVMMMPERQPWNLKRNLTRFSSIPNARAFQRRFRDDQGGRCKKGTVPLEDRIAYYVRHFMFRPVDGRIIEFMQKKQTFILMTNVLRLDVDGIAIPKQHKQNPVVECIFWPMKLSVIARLIQPDDPLGIRGLMTILYVLRPHDDPPMRFVTGTRSGCCGSNHSPQPLVPSKWRNGLPMSLEYPGHWHEQTLVGT